MIMIMLFLKIYTYLRTFTWSAITIAFLPMQLLLTALNSTNWRVCSRMRRLFKILAHDNENSLPCEARKLFSWKSPSKAQKVFCIISFNNTFPGMTRRPRSTRARVIPSKNASGCYFNRKTLSRFFFLLSLSLSLPLHIFVSPLQADIAIQNLSDDCNMLLLVWIVNCKKKKASRIVQWYPLIYDAHSLGNSTFLRSSFIRSQSRSMMTSNIYRIYIFSHY